MKVCVFIIFIVIQAVTCEKAVSKLRKKLIVPKMNEDCKKIKCASVEEPVCVKMRRLDLGRSMHIIAANKCELDYMKCHDDVEAKIVPMKYCGHNTAQTVGNKKNKMDKHIRVKRRVPIRIKVARNATKKHIKREGSEESTPTTKHGFKGNDRSKLYERKKTRLIKKKLARMQKNNFISNIISKTSVLNDVNRLKKKESAEQRGRQNKMHGADQHGRQNSKHGATQHGRQNKKHDADKHGRQNSKHGAAQHGRKNKKHDADKHGRQNSKHGAAQHGRQNDEPTISSEPDNDLDEDEELNEEWIKEPSDTELNHVEYEKELSYHLDDFDMFSRESTNESIESLDSDDQEEFDQICPSNCPSSAVMVCGRCGHGVYQTFLSTCHMKMFLCNHKDEELELVSRYPCVLSAPFLSEEGMKPKGVIQEEGDDDKILRFLICKQTGAIKKGPNGKPLDPRCNFHQNVKKNQK